ncbi:MAG: acetate--CoA ligase, partial [Archaeoglobi archaeon]|nr:acetate--CoA ligase [Candidatus Mnemosynella bozhongmuii]
MTWKRGVKSMLEGMFNPDSIAVIGASRDVGSVGHSILMNLKKTYRGRIYPVNPKAETIEGLKCYKSVKEIPDKVDLAIIVVPNRIVPQVLEECGQKRVKYVIVISAGFRETGTEGARLERECLGIVKEYGMRMLGPNCLGIIDTHTPMNATFAAGMARKGNIAFMSQSGALCTAILDWTLVENVGFSKFVSLGNKADLNETDFLEVFHRDDNTEVILAYLEGIKEGRRFIELAREVSKKKPIIVLKSGTSTAGLRAVSSHTGTLAGSEVAYQTAFKQYGILRARSVEEMFDWARAFSTQPRINGNRIAIVTNAGGPGILATDACEKEGLRLARFSDETVKRLREALPPAANFYNPVDVLGDARPDRYRKALEAVMEDEGVDGVLCIVTPQAMTSSEEVAEVIVEISKKYRKPILCSFMGGELMEKGVRILRENGIPNYLDPERAAKTFKAMVTFEENRRKERGNFVRFEVNREKVRRIIDAARRKGITYLGLETLDILDAYGIPVVKSRIVKNEEEAVKASRELGYPVVMKILSPQIVHKSDVGGVVVGIQSDEEAKLSYNKIIENVKRYVPDAEIKGVLVQQMVSGGVETIVGSTKDAQFDNMLMFGLGGIYVEVLKDVSFRLAPITREEAREMIDEIKSGKILKGYRGSKGYDIEAIQDVLLRVSQLITDFPEILE